MINVRLECLCAPERNFVDHSTQLTVNILILGQPRHVLGPLAKPVLKVVRLGNVIDHHLQLWKLLGYQRDVLEGVWIALKIKCQAVVREYLEA